MCAQHLPAKDLLLINTEATIETAKLVIDIDETPVGCEEADERVCFADVALQP